MDINKTLALEFKIRQEQVDNTVALIDDGKTIPFIARYRKELTGSLDDQLLRELFDRLTYLRNLTKRKEEVLASIESVGALTDEITAAVSNATTLVEVEDIYRPYKPKRKTRASVAREKGLEMLATYIMLQDLKASPRQEAEKFLNEEKGVSTVDEALQGAMDIIAEDISDDAALRKSMRALFTRTAVITSKATNDEAESVYKNYYEYSEPINKIPQHRILAIDRGEKEDMLKVSVTILDGEGEKLVTSKYVKNDSECAALVKFAC